MLEPESSLVPLQPKADIPAAPGGEIPVLELPIRKDGRAKPESKWAAVRCAVGGLQVGQEALLDLLPGMSQHSTRSSLSANLTMWKETQHFKWSLRAAGNTQLRVKKVSQRPSLVSDLVRDRSERMEHPAISPPAPVVEKLHEAAMKVLDGKIEKLKELRSLLEDPYIASVFKEMCR